MDWRQLRMKWDEKLSIYRKSVDKCGKFELKGKAMPYTSANGHMFSQLNKDGELGVRFAGDVQKKYVEKFGTKDFTSYGKVMKGYVLMPEKLWAHPDKLAKYLCESYDYITSLEPK
jgi:hypothetical protein